MQLAQGATQARQTGRKLPSAPPKLPAPQSLVQLVPERKYCVPRTEVHSEHSTDPPTSAQAAQPVGQVEQT